VASTTQRARHLGPRLALAQPGADDAAVLLDHCVEFHWCHQLRTLALCVLHQQVIQHPARQNGQRPRYIDLPATRRHAAHMADVRGVGHHLV